MKSRTLKFYFFSFHAVIFFGVVLSVCSPFGFTAENNSETIGLIQTYVDAVKTNDPGLIKDAWGDLNNSQDAITYMRQNMPQLYYLFQVRGLYLEMQEIQSRRPELFGDKQTNSATIEGAVETLKNDLSPGAIEVAKFSVSEPDLTRPRTNRDIALAAQGAVKIDNREIALSNPNQNKIDNKDFVQNRARSLFDQKFQEPATELVPRGDIFSKAQLPANPDVRVRGIFVDVILKRSSKEDRYLDIYLNDHLVVHDLRIGEALEFLRIYLEPGINTLRFSTSGQDQSKEIKSPFVIVGFKKTLQGDQKFSLNLPKGSMQALQVEAVY